MKIKVLDIRTKILYHTENTIFREIQSKCVALIIYVDIYLLNLALGNYFICGDFIILFFNKNVDL